MKLLRIPCYLEGYEDFGIFIGALLILEDGRKERIRKTPTFKEKVEREIESFLENHENNHAEIEKYFNR